MRTRTKGQGAATIVVEEPELPFPPACPARNPLGTFPACPMCDGPLAPEHAHFRCTACGWRDSCCD